MSLVQEIIDILSGANPRLEDALVKTKVLLHRLGQKGYVDWVNRELNGYSENDEVPPYRTIPSSVKITATDGFTRRWNDMPASTSHLDEKIRLWLEESKLRQSISSLESLARSEGDTFSWDIPPNLWGQLAKPLNKGIHIEYARCVMSKAQLQGVITQIRSRLLDFLLELDAKLPNDASEADVKAISKTVSVGNLLNNAMFGPNTTIVIGDKNTQTLNFVAVQTGNYDSLSKFLKEKGVPSSDLQSLRQAIDADVAVVDHANREFGPTVKGWLKSMLGKAVDASWQVEVGVAGGLLASALNAYYGWF